MSLGDNLEAAGGKAQNCTAKTQEAVHQGLSFFQSTVSKALLLPIVSSALVLTMQFGMRQVVETA